MAEAIPVDVEVEAKSSRLSRLLQSIPEALYAIAPEHEAALRDSLRDAKLAIVAKPQWVAHYEFASKTIRVSMRTFEIVWSATFAYLALHDLVWVPGVRDGKTSADLTDEPRVAHAMKLLTWAMVAADSGPSADELFEHAQRDELAAATDQLALCAIAFVLHHELAHHRLRHNHKAIDDAASIDRERDADREAVGWMLGGVKPESPEYQKRLLGAAMATAYLTTRTIERERLSSKSHPRAFDRLFNLLEEQGRGSLDPVWCFAMGAVKLHLDHRTIAASVGPFETCRDALNAYIEQLAEAAAQER